MPERELSGQLCACGCGRQTYLSLETHNGKGQRKGQPLRFLPNHKPTFSARRQKPFSPTYLSWKAMRQRCRDPHHKNWENYGGRGITVYDAWNDSFENFLADMGERPEGMTLDRIDPNGNYEPGNVRWATASDQRLNQRS